MIKKISFLIELLLLMVISQASWSVQYAANSDWHILSAWDNINGVYKFEASNVDIVRQCRQQPSGIVTFPTIQQAVQEVLVNNVIVSAHGMFATNQLRSYYGAPVVPCQHIINGDQLVWRIYSYAKVFAVQRTWPTVTATTPWNNVINETLAIIAAGSLPFIAVISFILFWRATDKRMMYSFALSCIFHSAFFVTIVPGFFNIQLDVMMLQKTGDSALWIGILLFAYCLMRTKLIHKVFFVMYVVTVLVSCVVILSAPNLDAAQDGTAIPFLATMLIMCSALVRVVLNTKRDGLNWHSISLMASLCVYVFSIWHDILTVEGYLYSYMIYSVGVLGGTIFFLLGIHAQLQRSIEEHDKLVVQREAAEESNRQKSAFLANMSHELRTPLNAVIGYSELLMEESRELNRPHLNSGLDNIRKSGDHLLQMINQILDLSRVEAGRLELSMKTLSVHETINAVMVLIKPDATRYNTKININLADLDSHICIYADPVRMNEIILNLLTNACKYGGGVVDVAAHSENGSVKITVTDNGIGLTDDEIKKMWQPFERLKADTTVEGTGIGLAITKNIVEMMEGNIGVHSKVHQGTTFFVSFKIADDAIMAEKMTA
ncbi:MAG: HAMP domain-containing histidine kinase [Gammaproteobacteria bacterium]|nr:HAMP domain-containing histidine kinase [Gammaproteobacteria bacterium]